MGGKVTDEQIRENIEIGKSALALRNLVIAWNLNSPQSHFDLFRTWQFAFWVTLLDSDLSLALTVGFATCAR